MDILERIDKLRVSRGWSINKLAEMSIMTQSTIANMFTRKTLPSISTLNNICDAFGITLSQFFATTEEPVQVTPQELQLLTAFRALTQPQQAALLLLLTK